MSNGFSSSVLLGGLHPGVWAVVGDIVLASGVKGQG